MLVKTFTFDDKRKLEIHTDNDPESPRTWDNLGTMACFHNNYTLGDEGHGIDSADHSGWEAMADHIRSENPDCVILPLYLYDHSGITISTEPFTCKWDSGQIGFIFVSRKKIEEEYGSHGGRTNEQIETYLRNEVAVYYQFLRGDIFGFILREPPCVTCGGPGEDGDSCWGFYGDDPLENGMSDHLDEKYCKALQDETCEKVSA